MPKINFAKLVILVGLIIKKFVTMHGQMNVKKKPCLVCILSVPLIVFGNV